jgi:hypothetical protein
MNIIHLTCFLATMVIILSGPAVQADTLYLESGAVVTGQIVGFDGNRYQVVIEGEEVTYEANEVRAFVTEEEAQRPSQPAQPAVDPRILDSILRRLDRIESQLNNFSQQYEQSSEQLEQRIFELNPASQVYVESQDGYKRRDGSYSVTGRLANDSNEFVRNFRLRGTLYDGNGNVFDQRDFDPAVPQIGPGASVGFQIVFPDSPKTVSKVEIVPYLATRSAGEDAGTYRQESPAAQYR